MIRFAVATLLAATIASDPRPKGASLHAWPEDVPRKAELGATGVVRTAANVVPLSPLWTAPASGLVVYLPLNVIQLDAVPDRKKFLAIVPEHKGQGTLTVVQNWRASIN